MRWPVRCASFLASSGEKSPVDQANSIEGQDREQEKIWQDFVDSDRESIRSAISPMFYSIAAGENPVDFPAPQLLLDPGISNMVRLYEDAYLEAADTLGLVNVDVTTRPYVPPLAWRKGGMVSAAWQIVELVWSDSVGSQLIATFAVEAWKLIYNKSRQYFSSRGHRDGYCPIATQSPQTIAACCAYHAQKHFGEFRPKAPQFRRLSWEGANAPASEGLCQVAVPLRNGSLIYLVTDRMRLLDLSKVNSNGAEDMDLSTWDTTWNE